MSDVIRYSCLVELVPTIEAAFAAQGYAIELPWQLQHPGIGVIVMRSGSILILISSGPMGIQAAIEVWGEAKTLAIDLLEALPIALHRAPTQRMAAS